jgi:methylmalonyl-CoA mutase cobalamin-binding domain/chain
MFDQIITAYNEAIFDTDKDRALEIVHKALQDGMSPEDIVFRLVMPAIEQMLTSVSEQMDANLAQHFLTSQIAAEVVEEMLPRFQHAPESCGTIVIGTSPGDFHGLGKRIVIGCLKARMIETIDLGLNVAPERFVDEAVAHGAHIIGISSMMVHTARGENGCRMVRQILRDRGLEDTIRIIVGGAPYRFDAQLYKEVGADAWAENGIVAGKVIADLLREVRS